MANPSRLKTNVLTISIAIIFVFFIGYGIETFYESPDYNDFCNYSRDFSEVTNEEDCLAMEGTWNLYPTKQDLNNESEVIPVPLQPGYCDLYDKCSKEWQVVEEDYSKNVFIITFIIGLIALIAGSYFIGIESVGSGIMGGGTMTIIYGTLRYWSNLNDMMRFIILGIVLFILIWIGYKKLKS